MNQVWKSKLLKYEIFSLLRAHFHFQLGIGNALFQNVDTIILNFIYGKSTCVHKVYVVKSKLYRYIMYSTCTNIFIHVVFFQIFLFKTDGML